MKRIIPALLCIAVGAGVTLGAGQIGTSLAHADTPALVAAHPDTPPSSLAPAAVAPAPTDVATMSTDAGWGLVESYGPIWGGMLLVFGFASAFLKRNQSKHWIAQGRTLAGIVAGVGILSAVLETHFGSGTWAGVVVTLFAAAKMLMNPTVQTAAAPARVPQSGRASVALLALLAVLAACSMSMSCGAQQKAALKDLAQCSELAAVHDLTPTVENIIASGVATWREQLAALGKQSGIDELSCAVAAAREFFGSKVGAGSAADEQKTAIAIARANEWLGEHGYAGSGS